MCAARKRGIERVRMKILSLFFPRCLVGFGIEDANKIKFHRDMVDRILIFASTTMIILKVVYILRDVVSEFFSKNVSRARIYI